MKAYEVRGDSEKVIAVYTDIQKAYNLQREHQLLNLRTKTVEISWFKWGIKKLFFM